MDMRDGRLMDMRDVAYESLDVLWRFKIGLNLYYRGFIDQLDKREMYIALRSNTSSMRYIGQALWHWTDTFRGLPRVMNATLFSQ